MAPPVSASIAVVAVWSSDPALLAWSGVAAFTAAVAVVQIWLGSSDLRILVAAHAVATPVAALVAPAASVPGLVASSAVAAAVVLSFMDRRRSTLLVLITAFLLYLIAMLVAVESPAALVGVAAFIACGAVSWALLTRLMADLRAGEGSYRHLFDRVPVGLYRTGLNGDWLDVNDALAELLRVPRDELIGRNAREFMADPSDLERLRAELGAGSDPLITDLRFRNANGEIIWVRDHTRAVVDADGGIVCFEGELQDVTEEKRHLDELEALIRSKSELIGAVSHELRTPLTAVVGFLDVVIDAMGDTDPEHVGLLQTAIEQAHEITGIVDDLLTAARIDNRELRIHPDDVDVAGTVDAAITSLGLVGRGAVASVDVVGDLVAYADAGRVRQILRNLIGNAVRHGSAPIRVEASIGDDGDVHVLVADEGAEMAPEVATRIFDAFFSGATTSSQPSSIGLGLSVSRRLARLMGGELSYRRVGSETQFVLSLPMKASKRAA